MILLLALLAGAGATTPPVDELRALLTLQPRLAASVRYNLRHAPEDYAGTYGRDLDGLFAFFELWQNAPVVPYAPTVTRRDGTPGGPGSPGRGPSSQIFTSPMWALAFGTTDACWVREPALLRWLEILVKSRGAFMDSRASWNASIEAQWRATVDFSDYVIPEEGFPTFNAFFTRQIKKELRPVDLSEKVAVAPSDGFAWLEDGDVRPGANFQLKADQLDVAELLGYHPLSDRFLGGSAVVNFLDATNYHRFWSPVSGTLVAVEQLGGLYVTYGTDAAVGDHRRAYVIYETPRFGLVAMVMVGMYDISSITLDVKAGDNVRKGDELGFFQYGGSEILTLFERGVFAPDADVRDAHETHDTLRKVGQRQGLLSPPRGSPGVLRSHLPSA